MKKKVYVNMQEIRRFTISNGSMSEGEWSLRFKILDLARSLGKVKPDMNEVRINLSELNDKELKEFIKSGKIPVIGLRDRSL